MNIIIIGAGNVGSTIAGVLSSAHDILMIESDSGTSESAKVSLNVSVIHGNGVNPKVIEEAVSRHSADVIIAAMPSDENNLFACMAAKNSKPHIKTVAKVCNPDFIISMNDGTYLGADQIISPELTSAKKLANIAILENAVDHDEIEGLGLAAAIFLVTDLHRNIVDHPLADIKVPDDCAVVAVYRNNEVLLLNEDAEIRTGDLLCVLGTSAAIYDFNRMMGVVRESKDIIILGGGIIGSNAAKALVREKRSVKIIEKKAERCEQLVKELSNVLVVSADGVDPNLLRNENVGKADVLICATDSDEKNLLACLVARDLGTMKVVSRYSKREYEDVFNVTGIKTIVGYHRLIANEVTKSLVSDEKSIMKMRHDGETLFSVTVKGDSKLRRSLISDLRLPEGAKAVCIIRNGKALFPKPDARIEENDDLLLFAYKANMHKVEKIIGTRMTDV
ncbi:MAG: Trk system potassium transporter TrkA [Methanomassiliicoccaceae archaeon]|nr:Trk system potassium transporter TrkA [Methanomassiliicoccaceae archaeon]